MFEYLIIQIIVDMVQVRSCISATRSHDIGLLDWTKFFKLSLGDFLYFLQLLLILVSVKSDARPTASIPACPATPMHLRLDVPGWFYLHDQVQVWQVDAASTHVGGQQCHHFALSE